MARHCKTVWGKITPETTEASDGSLAKAVYDVVNGKTILAIAIVKFSTIYAAALCVFDDV